MICSKIDADVLNHPILNLISPFIVKFCLGLVLSKLIGPAIKTVGSSMMHIVDSNLIIIYPDNLPNCPASHPRYTLNSKMIRMTYHEQSVTYKLTVDSDINQLTRFDF